MLETLFALVDVPDHRLKYARQMPEPETQQISVIALTARVMAGDREKGLEAGCDEFDTKPIELPRLLGKIEALLGIG